MPRGPMTAQGTQNEVSLAGINMVLAAGTWRVSEAPRFGEKISTGSFRYADFNQFESAHALSSLVGGYGLRRYSDVPDPADPKVQSCYDETDDCDCRFGPAILAPQRLLEDTGLDGPVVWVGEVTPILGALQGQTQFVAIGGTKVSIRGATGLWNLTTITLPATVRKGAVGTFNGQIIIGFGADALAIYTNDLSTTTPVLDLFGVPIYIYAFTSDRAATYAAGGTSSATANQIIASTNGVSDYDTAHPNICSSSDGAITGLNPGGGLALLYIGREHELGEIDNNGIYRTLVPFDSYLPTNCSPMRWGQGGVGGGEQKGSVRIFFSRDHSLWAYTPSSDSAGSIEDMSVWGKQGFRPQIIKGITTAIQGTARWLYHAITRLTGNLSSVPSPFRIGVPNLVSNPSFEIDLAGWSVLGAGTSALRVTPDAADGIASLQLTFDGTTSFYGLQTSVTGLIPGTQYTLSGFIKRTAGVGGITVDVEEPGIIDTPGLAVSSGSGTPGWQRFSEVFTYPSGGSGTALVRCFGHTNPAGTVQFDGIQLERSANELDSYLLAVDVNTGVVHPVGSLGNVQADAMGVTSLFGTNPLLFVGSGADLLKIILPLDGENPVDDSAMLYQLSGTLTMPDIDLGFPDEDKIGLFFRVVGTAEGSDGFEGLQAGDHAIDVEISFDGGPYQMVGTASTSPMVEFEIPTFPTFKRAKPRFTLRTNDPTTTPQLLGFSMRVSLNSKLYRIWEFDALVPFDVYPTGAQSLDNPQTIIDAFWRARRAGTPVLFEDRWQFVYKVRILQMAETEIAEESLNTKEERMSFRLLEVSGPVAGPYDLAYGDPRTIYGGPIPNSTYGLQE